MKYLNPRYLATQVLPRFLALFSALGGSASALHITGSQGTHLGAPLPTDMGSSLPYIDSNNKMIFNHKRREKKDTGNVSVSQYLIGLANDGHWGKIMRFMYDMEDKGYNINGEYGEVISEVIIFQAVKNGKLEVCRYFLDRGIDPNVKDEDNVPLLSYAAQKGNVEMAKLLLKHGADPNAQDSYGKRVLSYVQEFGDNTKIVELLRNAGAIDDEVVQILRQYRRLADDSQNNVTTTSDPIVSTVAKNMSQTSKTHRKRKTPSSDLQDNDTTTSTPYLEADSNNAISTSIINATVEKSAEQIEV